MDRKALSHFEEELGGLRGKQTAKDVSDFVLWFSLASKGFPVCCGTTWAVDHCPTCGMHVVEYAVSCNRKTLLTERYS